MRYIFALQLLILSSNLFAGQSYCKYHQEVNGGLKPVSSSAYQMLQAKYDVKFHHLNLNVERTSTTISGNVRTIATVVQGPLDTFAFELYGGLTIDSIVSNGSKLLWTSYYQERKAVLPQTIQTGANIDLTIYYKGTPPSSGSAAIGNGFSNGTSGRWGNQATWSLSQPFAAYEWWPCKQSLYDKIDSSWVFITTDATNKAASNGVLERVVPLGNGKARYEWKSRTPISYYLISVAVAKYVEYNLYAHPEGSSDSILIQNYIYDNPQTLATFKGVIDTTALLLEKFSELLGPYPFAHEKYGHAMAPFSGGMEHQTMSSMGFFDFGIVAHELGHQWFGDHVTCSSWSDIFVNEGFASYSEYLAEELFKSTASTADLMLDVHNSVMSQPGGSVWVADSNNSTRIFSSRLSYDKGSAIIHMIRYEVNNDSLFFLALRNYQAQFSNSVASASDFKQVLESTTGLDFTDFYNQWFYGEGYPTYSSKWNFDKDKFVVQMSHSGSSSLTSLFKTHLDILVRRASLSDTIICIYNNASTQQYQFSVNDSVVGMSIDPDNWILNKIASISKDTTLYAQDAMGLAEIEANKISVFPNPVHDVLQVTGIENSSYRIMDSYGRVVKNGFMKTGDKISVYDLATSTYTIEFDIEREGITRLRFVKN
jgi:aminopeptidase N